jgi:hypothetical protein
MKKTDIIIDLVCVIEAAIRAGDWKVDGACDPDSCINLAEEVLREEGYVRDGITGQEFIKE